MICIVSLFESEIMFDVGSLFEERKWDTEFIVELRQKQDPIDACVVCDVSVMPEW